MSEESHITHSQRRRQLIRQGDIQVRRQPPGSAAAASEDETAGEIDARADAGPNGRRSDELVDGRYRLLGRLGSGRLGDIYEARIESGPESVVERFVALQLFDRRIAADRALIDKLRRGYAALRAGPHRNVVRLQELGHDAKTWYLVMERLEGASLRFVVDDLGALPVEEAMPIVRSVGDALSYLHAKGMVHGAVTPSAVFATEDYEVKLLDIVPADPPSGLPAESVPDSRQARAPEPADDVFGLACLTYELLTGRHPYNYATAAEAARLGLEPAAIGHLPPPRWHALARGLATARDERTASVAVFLLDLGIAGAERAGGSDGAVFAGRAVRTGGAVRTSGAAVSDDAPFIPTARDRLVTPPSPEPARSRWFWPVFGAAVVGFLAAVVWVYQVPIRDTVVGRLTTAGINVVAPGNSDGDTATQADSEVTGGDAPQPASAARSGEVARVDLSSAADPDPTADAGAIARRETASRPSDGETETTAVPSDAETTSRSSDAETTALPPDTETTSRPSDAETTALPTTSEPAIDAETDVTPAEASPISEAIPVAPPEPSRFTMGAGPHRAVEGESAAAVTVRREGNLASRATIVWWTTEDTARPGSDYADLGQQTETFDPGVETVTLYVPLVDDGLGEPPKGFMLSIGQPIPGSGRVETIATTGVIIYDDDSTRR